jgi:hypothetical protein
MNFIMPLPPLSPIATAVHALYGAAKNINDTIDHLIDGMKKSENATVARSGRVFEAAKVGFGIGYISSATIITAGQLLMGNPLTVSKTAFTIVTFTNPYVMTAAALGAVVYGYAALNDQERDELHQKLGDGLAIGVELIRSIIQFAIDKAKTLLSKDNLAEMKTYIAGSAAAFGRKLSDVTRKASDKAKDLVRVVKTKGRVIKTDTKEKLPAIKQTVSGGVDTIVETGRETRRKITKRLARKK